ncbi:MAG: hypothetical protein NTV51_22470 [Verrucomicrobia bacterium]|nr:hypothetical protein [Verrucomicrobiota bacterium]
MSLQDFFVLFVGLALMGGFAWVITWAYSTDAVASLQEWAKSHGYVIKDTRRKIFGGGPYWAVRRGEVILEFVAETTEGQVHQGWALCYISGFSKPTVKVTFRTP